MRPFDAEYIRFICTYDADSGSFVRVMKKSWRGNWVKCYSIPNSVTAYGYLQMSVEGRPYAVHRLIWLHVTGSFPECDIDHIDGNRLNNSWVNLRSVTRRENLRNSGIRVDNTSGVPGVSFAKDRRLWCAYIETGEGRKYIGHFRVFDDAVKARRGAEVEYGFHTNHGARPSWRG